MNNFHVTRIVMWASKSTTRTTMHEKKDDKETVFTVWTINFSFHQRKINKHKFYIFITRYEERARKMFTNLKFIHYCQQKLLICKNYQVILFLYAMYTYEIWTLNSMQARAVAARQPFFTVWAFKTIRTRTMSFKKVFNTWTTIFARVLIAGYAFTCRALSDSKQ